MITYSNSFKCSMLFSASLRYSPHFTASELWCMLKKCCKKYLLFWNLKTVILSISFQCNVLLYWKLCCKQPVWEQTYTIKWKLFNEIPQNFQVSQLGQRWSHLKECLHLHSTSVKSVIMQQNTSVYKRDIHKANR